MLCSEKESENMNTPNEFEAKDYSKYLSSFAKEITVAWILTKSPPRKPLPFTDETKMRLTDSVYVTVLSLPSEHLSIVFGAFASAARPAKRLLESQLLLTPWQNGAERLESYLAMPVPFVNVDDGSETFEGGLQSLAYNCESGCSVMR